MHTFTRVISLVLFTCASALLVHCGGETSSNTNSSAAGGGSAGSGQGGSVGGSGGSGADGGSGGSATGATAGTSSGGTSSGGTSSGGTSTGGSSAGGATGGTSTGGSSTGGAAGGPAVKECVTNEDCVVFSDCCTCTAVPNDQLPASCDIDCDQDACSAIGVPYPNTPAICSFGQCVLPTNCQQSTAACDSLPPVCPPGQIAIVDSSCWGGCVSVLDCPAIDDCAQCGPGVTCGNDFGEAFLHNQCLPIAPGCNGVANCECMGNELCDVNLGGMICIDHSPSNAPSFSCECPVCDSATP